MARIKKFLHENLKNDKILIQRVAYGVSPVAAIRFFFRRGKMYKINDYIMYKRDVCKIKAIKEKYMNNQDYYQIYPIHDDSLIINVPVNSKALRALITKEQALSIIDNIKNVQEIDSNDKNLENIYKELLSTEDEQDLIKIIKTTYLRNKKKLDEGKKAAGKDTDYFNMAENLLYTELSIALGMTKDNCKNFIIEKITKEQN